MDNNILFVGALVGFAVLLMGVIAKIVVKAEVLALFGEALRRVDAGVKSSAEQRRKSPSISDKNSNRRT